MRGAGWDLVRYDPLRSIESRRSVLLSRLGIRCVYDVGANIGQYGEGLRKNGYEGKIVSFEPLSSAYARLRERARADGRWDTHQVAVGAEAGELEIHVSRNSYSSSALPILEKHVTSAPESAYVSSEIAPVKPLDALVDRHELASTPSFLKIDVQGFEASVLDGAVETLRHMRGVELELSLEPLYEGQTLMAPMVERMRQLGFGLVSLEPGFAEPESGHLLQVDGIFTRFG
ncbi:MAG: FkbM family methyltransferase [Deltaproteobacteria bacterium]|nr:FkbM family methyltransferase [Deltaproteobacteria bacterium]